MKASGLFLFLLFASILGPANTFAHMYDAVGVEAAIDHVHENHNSTPKIKNNCFIDPKLGPICK